MALGTTHLSLYQLTIEPGTRFATMVDKQAFTPLDADTSARLFEVTDDGLEWPGVAVAVHTADGGRADGVVWTGDTATQVAFGDCWNGGGDTVWSGGDEGVIAAGDPEACVTGSLIEP